MQRRAQFDASPDDLAFLQSDDGRYDFDPRFRPCPHADQLLEHPVISRPAIRIAGAVFRDCSYVNRTGANRFGPAYRHGKKMRVSKGHVGYGNRAAMRARSAQLIFRNRNALVRERGSANRAKMIELHGEAFAHAVEIRNVLERAPLTLLSALAIPGMEDGNIRRAVIFPRNR